jgi:hypothetical protein
MTLLAIRWCDLLGRQTYAYVSHVQRVARADVFADLMANYPSDLETAAAMSSWTMLVAFGFSQTSVSRLHNLPEVWSVVHIAPG